MCRAAFPSLGMKTRNELLALTAVTRALELMLAELVALGGSTPNDPSQTSPTKSLEKI